MFEGFPYSNFHQLNLDWIIKIAKDFLDQYTHIQETIDQGLEDLDTKAQQLQALLDAWYAEHSQDIANQLAEALQDLNEWYTTHENYLDDILLRKTNQFNAAADSKGAEVIASIPADYTALANTVAEMAKITNGIYDPKNMLFNASCFRNEYWNAGYHGSNNNYTYFIVPVVSGHTYNISPFRILSTATTLITQNVYVNYAYTADFTGDLYITYWNDNTGWKFSESADLLNVVPFDFDIVHDRLLNSITDSRNILFSAQYIQNKYYNGTEYSSPEQYDYFIFPVVSGNTYHVYPGCRFFVKADGTELHAANDHNPFDYVADYTGAAFLTLWKHDIYPQIVTEFFRPLAVVPFNTIDLAYHDYRYKGTVNFRSKKILNIGDSIAENRPQYDAISYAVQFAEQTGAIVTTDYAVSGATLALAADQGDRGCIYNQALKATLDHPDEAYDIIMVDGGANDWSLNRPLGSIVGTPGQYTLNDYNQNFNYSTVAGAIEGIFKLLRAQYVSSIIVFVIPHKHTRTGAFWEQILDVIREACSKWSVIVMDMDKSGELNTRLNNMRIYTDAGGTHPNTEGYRKFYVPYLIETLYKFFR